MGRLDGKTALITGGTAGIGLAVAKRFIEEGARVAITGRSAETTEIASRELGSSGFGVRANVASLVELDDMVADVREAFGSIDILMANAGVAEFQSIPDVDEESYDRIMGINVKGTFFTIQKSRPLLNDGGSVIVVGSAGAHLGQPNTSVYSASKAAIRSFARTLSSELIERNIRVTCLTPGPTQTSIFSRTNMSASDQERVLNTLVSSVPAGRIGNVDEIAAAALYLASDDARWVVGSELVIDGGKTQL